MGVHIASLSTEGRTAVVSADLKDDNAEVAYRLDKYYDKTRRGPLRPFRTGPLIPFPGHSKVLPPFKYKGRY